MEKQSVRRCEHFFGGAFAAEELEKSSATLSLREMEGHCRWCWQTCLELELSRQLRDDLW